MNTTPSLPTSYELVALDTVDSAAAEAKRLATQGADEGTLVWAKEQTAGYGRFGAPWISCRGNFHCALVLRPDEPSAMNTQLSYVAAISLGLAIANVSAPRSELYYRWPNDILLYDAKLANIILEGSSPGSEGHDWLVLGAAVNVQNHPEDMDPPATSLVAEGTPDATDAALLEYFTRHFLSWINRWAEEGFAPVRKMWMQQADGIGKPIEVRLETETVRGNFADIDEQGALIIALPNGGRRSVSVAEFFLL
ncbi:MAG: biotin--[acetyl-CoA-carboxylase] ligase [Acidiferrobacterales bacterium]